MWLGHQQETPEFLVSQKPEKALLVTANLSIASVGPVGQHTTLTGQSKACIHDCITMNCV